ncbi:Fructosamine kinase-domain-containing protein [Podospora didyma]|uniref:protein-ribulosamine 3-kinase n=1 Tax=Podospora didyma TaxID=330526 RepID=A0AAE0P3W7_9PEZI|nr:Fructosamine kinase-domain-containing protein [Podospora didyma]
MGQQESDSLPEGLEFVNVTALSDLKSLWSKIAKVEARAQDGSTRLFFLKTASGDSAKAMFEGEFEGMVAIHEASSTGFAPKPIAWGEFRDLPGRYFFLEEFVEMADDGTLPDPEDLASKLAQMHKSSASPTGKFGFHVTTCNGTTPQKVEWEESWAAFFARGLQLIDAITPMFEKVVPHLLGRLQQGPNPIKHSLIHGDLWCGNTAVNKKNGATVTFDPAAFYGHNEYDLGNWRPVRNRFGKAYIDAYLRHYSPAEPKEEFDNRNLLYSMYDLLFLDSALCILFPGEEQSVQVKKAMIEDMNYLSDKYNDTSKSS